MHLGVRGLHYGSFCIWQDLLLMAGLTLIFSVLPQGRKLESFDRHSPNPFVDPPLASPDAGTIRAAVFSHPKQAGKCTAEMASQ